MFLLPNSSANDRQERLVIKNLDRDYEERSSDLIDSHAVSRADVKL